MLLRWKFGFVFAAAALAMTATSPVEAQARVEIGALECHGPGTVSFFVGSVSQYDCLFHPSVGRPHHYVATIRRFGVDVGITGNTVLTWLVFAPSRHVGYGALAGTYVGPSAGAAVGVGLHANALIGGSGNSFGLQPLSVAGQTGLNVAAGIAGLELVPAGPMRHHRHRRH